MIALKAPGFNEMSSKSAFSATVERRTWSSVSVGGIQGVSSADKYRYSKGGAASKDIFFKHGAQPDGIVLSRNAQP